MINADNLMFLSPISIRLQSELYDLIESDARLFGFYKNGKSNINGFLNKLLPSIIEIFSAVSDSKLFHDIEEYITPVRNPLIYLDTIFKPLLNSNNITISFRVNKAHEKDFQYIYQQILPFYNMDFSALIRTLLACYITNRLAIRERFFHFKNYTEISNAIEEKKQCLFFLKTERIRLSCITIAVSPISDRNILLGIDPLTGNAHAIPFRLIETAVTQDEFSKTAKNNLKLLKQAYYTYIKTEKSLQKNK